MIRPESGDSSQTLFRLMMLALVTLLGCIALGVWGFDSKQGGLAALGEFVSGMVNPILTFLTFLGLLWTVILQGSVHAGFDVALGDLREWHMLRTWCRSCSHHATVKPAGLIERYRKGALFSPVERALCTNCDRGGPVRLEIHKLPRN